MSHNKILFSGDPHGNFANIVSAVFTYRPKAIILLGDYNLEMPLEHCLKPIIGMTEIFWIAGNHDFDSHAEYENLFNSALADNNLHLNVIEIEGFRIAGLGGIFAGKVWKPGELVKWESREHWHKSQPRHIKKMSLKVRGAIWHHEFERMKKTIKADILVTHEAPSCHPYGFSAIDELAEAIGAKQIIHGHHHDYYQDKLEKGISVTGTSLAGIVNLSGKQLIKGGSYDL